MRILFLATSHPQDAWDPSGHFVAAEATLLRDHGAEVFVVQPRGDLFRFPGVLANLRAKPWMGATLLPSMIRGARDLRGAQRQILAEHATWDRVIAHWSIPTGLVALRFDAPIELVSHGQDVRLLVGLPKLVREALVCLFLGRIDAWRFVSEALRQELFNVLDGETRARLLARSYVAAAGLDWPDNISSTPVPTEAYWICVGRLIPSKEVHRAIEHAMRCRKRLYIVGDGPERARLENLADTRFVSFLGALPRNETLRWLRGAEALLFASRAEGESTVLREARHLGVRVIDLRADASLATSP